MATYAAFNNLNTILAVPLKAVLTQTYKKFVEYFPEKKIGIMGDGKSLISEDITISTFNSLRKCALEKCELLMIDEIQSTTGEEICNVLKEVKPIRTFGFTATDEGLFNKAEKVIQGLFGERLIHITYQEGQEVNAVVPCVVYFVDMSDNVIINSSTVEGKINHGIKNCQERNELIGQICSSIPNQWQTIVFVDHVHDHLIKLYKEMPTGTKFVHRNADKKELGTFALTTKQQKQVVDAFQDNEFQFLIATDAFRAGVDVPNVRVVVQAAGGSSEVEILQEALRGSRVLTPAYMERLDVDAKTHFVLIDIMDKHDPTLEGMSHKRMEIYRKQGWEIRQVKTVNEIDWLNHQKRKL